MDYFSNLPKLEYEISGYPTADMRNLFFNLNITINDDYIQIYRIDQTKRLDQISFELYNDVSYWWIIALLNNIQDIIFDLPVDEEYIHSVVKEKTLEQYESIAAGLSYYQNTLDEMIIENDEKRIINVINPVFMDEVLTEIIKLL